MSTVWVPSEWEYDLLRIAAKVSYMQPGDVVRNPVYDCRHGSLEVERQAYALAEFIDAGLRLRRLRIDHTNTLIGIVERIT